MRRRGLLLLAAVLVVGGCTSPEPGTTTTRTSPTSTTTSSRPTSTAPTTTAATTTATSTTEAGARCTAEETLIESATWIEVQGADSLEVTPADALRECGLLAADAGWQQLLALEPDADSPGMLDQYLCHLTFAPDKGVWHLEPWRPVVDRAELLRAGCNPGGPDPDLGP